MERVIMGLTLCDRETAGWMRSKTGVIHKIRINKHTNWLDMCHSLKIIGGLNV